MFGLPFYLILIGFTCSLFTLSQYSCAIDGKYSFCNKHGVYPFLFILCPIILVYSIRYGIGTDYFAYEKIYNKIHDATFIKYLSLHKRNIGEYYVEPGYFIINKISPSFIFVHFFSMVIMLLMVYFGTIKMGVAQDIALPVLIFYCLLFLYSMNGVRFSIALSIAYYGFNYLLKRKPIKWLITIYIASLFHKTLIVFVIFIFLMNSRSKAINRIKNILVYCFVLFFPFLIKILLSVFSAIPMFSRYFSVARYLEFDTSINITWIRLIIPILFPLLFFKHKFIFTDKYASVLYRIYLFEIPLIQLGRMNLILARLSRVPQMAEIAFVPYVLSSIKNKKHRYALTFYYAFYYLVFFCYYAVVGDKGESLPYKSILGIF